MTEQQEVQPSAAAPVADNNKPAPGTTGSKKGSSGTVLGGIAILLALGLRLLNVKQIPVGDLLPALFLAPALVPLAAVFA